VSEGSRPRTSSLRQAVDNDGLDANNPLHYLVLLATEAKRYDGAWDGDTESAARWTVTQWCQEIGFVPDLRDYGAGEMVDKHDDLESYSPAFFRQAATDGGQHEPAGTFDGEWIDIPFNEWSEKRLREGRKTATTRTKRYGDPGDRFRAAGANYELTHVVKVPLGIVAEQFYDVEGARTTAAFVEVWEDIHYRRGFERDWEVWLHLFREVAHGD